MVSLPDRFTSLFTFFDGQKYSMIVIQSRFLRVSQPKASQDVTGRILE